MFARREEKLSDLVELTFEELGRSLRAAAEVDTKSSAEEWRTLIQVADELTTNKRADLLTKNRKWCLREVSVKGFRGARGEVSLRVDNDQGITALFGQNGSGKSSLAEAVRVALEGRTGGTHLGATGTIHELWSSEDQRSQGVEEATVSVVLWDRPTADRLTINANITESGVLRSGTLHRNNTSIELGTDSPEWQLWTDAVRASPPVLAYAELTDELQRKKDLQIWLTSCLAMDNASRIFDSRVQDLVRESSDAKAQIVSARDESIRKVSEADALAAQQGVEAICPVDWVDIESRDHLNQWLNDNGFVAIDRNNVQLDADIVKRLPVFAKEFIETNAGWTKMAKSALLTPPVAKSIVEMSYRVTNSSQGDNNGVCPTCGTPHTDWRNHLLQEAAKLKAVDEYGVELRKLVQRSADELIVPLQTCLSVLPADFDGAEKMKLHDLVQAAFVARQSVDDFDADLLNAIYNLSRWSQRSESGFLMTVAMEASGQERQWRCDRWDALARYLSVIEENIDLAVKHDALKRARAKWNSHLARIRQERSSDLHALMGPAVALLLEDAGIYVEAVNITKSHSRLELKNMKGESVELAHLSAGQRNALILGPVIATADSGIFAFSILDDPVHAFDDFRVDKLSATLADLSKRQSLIVATHDARFIEYLRVHAGKSFQVNEANRDDDGQISLIATSDPPTELIKFGRELTKDLKKRNAPEGREQVTSLLRMALDEAFESVALRHFARCAASKAENDRRIFEDAYFTQERKKKLSKFLEDSPDQHRLLSDAWQKVSTASKRWSSAVHDPSQVPDFEQLEGDIEIAESAIELLRRIYW